MTVYSVSTTVQPAVEPVTLTEAKAQCRVDAHNTADDALLSRLIRTARQLTEDEANRRWITQTVAIVFPCWPACGPLELPVGPVQSVTSVGYRDGDGSDQTLTGHEAWVAHRPPLVGPPSTGWPALEANRMQAVTVTAVAGYGDAAASVPAHAAQAMLLAIGHWYGFRGDGVEKVDRAAGEYGLPLAAIRLLKLLRGLEYH